MVASVSSLRTATATARAALPASRGRFFFDLLVSHGTQFCPREPHNTTQQICEPLMNTREIPLSQGLVAIVSAEDYERMCVHKWHAVRARNTFYAATKVAGKTTYMHRLVLGAGDGMHVDHRDDNGLNNQRTNLRECTRGENARKRKTSGSATGVRGVSLERGRYIARIGHGGKFHYLGTFASVEAAGAAYARAAQEKFGAFAPLEAL